MFDGAERFGPGEFETELVRRGGRRLTEPQSNFYIRKFPEVCVDYSTWPLADEEASASLNNERYKVTLAGSGSFAEVG